MEQVPLLLAAATPQRRRLSCSSPGVRLASMQHKKGEQAAGQKPAAPAALFSPSAAAGTAAEASLQGSPTSRAADGQTPSEARGLHWPAAFCETPRGERLELLEDNALARRTSGVGYGSVFVGPLSLEKGAAYFEIEIEELEPKRSQTMAIGVCSALPPQGRVSRAERARDLGQGSFLLGYDLPKVFAHGAEVAKIGAREWRPLKELSQGDRVGLLVERANMELTVFVNGTRRATASLANAGGGRAGDSGRWPAEVWGVVDIYGTVRAVRLLGPGAAASDSSVRRPQLLPCPSAASAAPGASASLKGVPPAPPRWTGAPAVPSVACPSSSSSAVPPSSASAREPGAMGRMDSTQELGAPGPSASPASAAVSAGEPQTPLVGTAAFGSPRGSSRASLEMTVGPRKRLRMGIHPCGCMVHVLRDTGDVVHVPRMGDFVIGRNPKSCNLTLDSAEVPNMVSRRHAVIVCAEDAVMVVDCESVNGTYVNGRRVGRETLRQGDELVIGNPAQSPRCLKLIVSMPPSA
mmetsp:Transcript_33582/g.96323  ORF Transcript_33582/g.96323 Transcript_33582/m.96323 type:complete len:522 (+) Transcript_33582:64-1629(+)